MTVVAVVVSFLSSVRNIAIYFPDGDGKRNSTLVMISWGGIWNDGGGGGGGEEEDSDAVMAVVAVVVYDNP